MLNGGIINPRNEESSIIRSETKLVANVDNVILVIGKEFLKESQNL